MKVFELERLLAAIRNKEQDVLIGFTSQNGDYTEGKISNIDTEGVVGQIFIEADEI